MSKSNFYPTNKAVNIIIEILLQKLPGSLHIYKHADATSDTIETVYYTPEISDSHVLELKIDAPIILLRNLHSPSLCNKIRLSVKKLMPNVIDATIMTRQAAEDVFISRILYVIIPSDSPFQFKRLQFPDSLT